MGPHFDSYDVFLIQSGRPAPLAHWPLSPMRSSAQSAAAHHRELAPEAEFLLGPGDMLYLPPRWRMTVLPWAMAA